MSILDQLADGDDLVTDQLLAEQFQQARPWAKGNFAHFPWGVHCI
jgi:hypothetical protein